MAMRGKAEMFVGKNTMVRFVIKKFGEEHKNQALFALADELETSPTRIVTTRAVLMEIGNALSKQRYRPAAVELLLSLENDPKVEIVPVSGDLYAQAFKLFSERTDKEWGLVDCVSFVVMRERGITDALTSDDHFRQAGFNALMRK
jgi:predicted nucleic acid-binding protein